MFAVTSNICSLYEAVSKSLISIIIWAQSSSDSVSRLDVSPNYLPPPRPRPRCGEREQTVNTETSEIISTSNTSHLLPPSLPGLQVSVRPSLETSACSPSPTVAPPTTPAPWRTRTTGRPGVPSRWGRAPAGRSSRASGTTARQVRERGGL